MFRRPFWLAKPSRRPSRRHPKKISIFDTNFYRFWTVLGTPQGTQNGPKNIPGGLGGTPILAPKALSLRNRSPGCNFRRCWLPKRLFWKTFSTIFCIWGVFYQQQPCKLQDIMCLATVRLARHTGSISSSSSSSNSSLPRHVMVCNISSCKSQQQQQQQQQQQ